MKTARTKIGLGCCALALLFALPGCGGSGKIEANRLSGISILEKTKPLDQSLVKQSDIAKASDASGVKTLLQLWQTLQYQDYESAPNFFYPRLVNFLGVAQLALALRNDAGLWSSTKPNIVEARTTGDTARVVFVIDNLLGKATPVTVTFRKAGGAWTINYFSLLDEALRTWAQQRAQTMSTSSPSQARKEGLVAGTRAFQLPSQYLEEERSGKVKASPKESSAPTTAAGAKSGKSG